MSENLQPITQIVSVESLPEILGFLKEPLDNVLSKLKVSHFLIEPYNHFNRASYWVKIRAKQKLSLELPGVGFAFVLNPEFDSTNQNAYSEFSISLIIDSDRKGLWEGLNIDHFSGDSNFIYALFIDFYNLSNFDITERILSLNYDNVNDFIDAINNEYSSSIITDINVNDNISQQIEILIQKIENDTSLQSQNISPFDIAYDLYIAHGIDISERIKRLDKLFENMIFIDSSKKFIFDSLLPKFNLSTRLTCGVEFPRKMLLPIDQNGNIAQNENIKSILIFDPGEFYFSSEGGFGFQNELTVSFPQQYPEAQIGNTGIKIGFTTAYLDLSSNTNIPQATSAGYDNDFKGVFIQEATITLPNYFNQDPNSSSAIIRGRNLLIGTGGFSGTIGLEAKTAGDPSPLIKANFGGGFSVSLDAFDITFQQNAIISSNIHGTMKIPGFKDTTGADAEIHIDAWIGTNGEFSVTASEDQGITALRIPDILDVTVKSLSVGRKGGRFFVAVSGAIAFHEQDGFIGQFIPDKIEIQKLLIWQDGQMEYEGGTLVLPNAITLKVGPVALSVTAIGFGSHEQQHEGQLRKYKFFEFSGGVSINPGGVDARGDGIKFYYTVDDDPNAGRNPHRYIRIQGISIDLIIPGSSSPDKAALLLKGYLAMKDPKPGNEQAGEEYAGGITFSLPRLKMSGSASMRLNPKVPAFIVDTDLELSNPILLGSTGLGIYGFRGLLGQRYVASKTVTGLAEDAPWWQYYKAKVAPDYKEGVQISKFDQTPGFSFGAGASLATAMDGGRIFSSKLFFLLSLPEVFLLQGQGQILKERIGLDTTNDPLFFALLSISKTSVEAALGADFLISDTKKPGKIATVSALIEMGFFFGNSSAWYVNIGKDMPESRRVNARVLDLFDAYFYLMLSSSGIRAGAGAKFELDKKFGPLRAELRAYIDVAGKIAFQPKQYGASIQLGGKVGLYIFKFGFAISADAALAGEAPQPFIVTGSLKVCIQILKKDFCAKFEFSWVKDTTLDTDQIALMNRAVAVKGLNMLTQETFDVHTSATSLSALTPSALDNYAVPMDSYIDMAFLKGVLPSASVKGNFGGNTQGASYVDYVSPQKSKSSRVRHEYYLDEVNIYSWNGSAWQPYDIYAAATPLEDAPFVTSDLTNLKKGYWQYQQAGLHNKLRIMAQSPLNFVSQGTGDLVVEDLGITTETVFCPPDPISKTCIDFNAYGKGEQSGDILATVPSNQVVSYKNLLIRINGDQGTVLFLPYNGLNNALAINNGNTMEVLFTDPVSYISLRLNTGASNVLVHYYQRTELPNLTSGNLPQFAYTLIETKDIASTLLDDPVIYNSVTSTIDKIVIEPGVCKEGSNKPVCNRTISQQAKDLVPFFNQIIKGEFKFPINLYPNYDSVFNGVFQGTSLYPEITQDGTVITLSMAFSDKFSIGFVVTDNYGFSCTLNLYSSVPIDWNLIQGFVNIRPLNPKVGTNYTFEFDALLPGDVTITLKGDSCYPVIHCFDSCSLLIYQLCYLKFDDAQHNATLPGQTAVQLETDVVTEGFNESIQPIWRPDTYYAVEVKTEDKLFKDGSSSLITSYANNHIFGFKTKGPIGFFHQGNPTYEHLLSQDREAEFKLTSLQYYIDFEKSYPNADGVLINAKPLFYVDPELLLFYLKNYVYEFYRNWDTYQNNEEVEIELITTIADPAPDTTLPPALPIAVTWVADDLPGFVHDAVILDNMIENGNPCVNTTPISPIGVHSVVSMNRLEPLKLYTAIFKARYKTASQSEYAEQEVHRYVFQTSRYESFQEQVNSYVLERDEEDSSVITKAARFEVVVTLDNTQLTTAQEIVNHTLDVNSPLRQKYAYDYDKIISGIFKLGSLHPAMATEFNLIQDELTGHLLGVLIRNPEPFNDPKIPVTVLETTIGATFGSNVLDKKVFSQDGRNIFLTNSTMQLVPGSYDFQFKYLQWSGNQYEEEVSVGVEIEVGE